MPEMTFALYHNVQAGHSTSVVTMALRDTGIRYEDQKSGGEMKSKEKQKNVGPIKKGRTEDLG